MKKSILFLLFLVFLSLPTLSAIEFSVNENFSQGGTFSAKLSGNFFKPVSESDVIFFNENVRVPMVSSVEKISGDYYVSAQLSGKSPGNYSVEIQNAKYYSGAQIIEQNLTKNFQIAENKAEFSIAPAFVSAKGDFSISVQNLVDNEIIVAFKAKNSSSSSGSSGGFFDLFFSSSEEPSGGNEISVKSGETKQIKFSAADFAPMTLQIVELRSNATLYEIPVYIDLNQTLQSNVSSEIRFDQSEFDISLPLNSSTSRIAYLSNLGSEPLDGVQILFSSSLKPYIKVSEENVSISANSSQKISFDFFSGGRKKFVEGQIRARTSDGNYAYIPVFLNFTEGYVSVENSGDVSLPACSELNGTVCSAEQTCSGNSQITRNEICCLGVCEGSVESSGTSNWAIFGWIIIAVIVFLVALFYFMRYRKVTRVVDLLKVAKEK